MAKFIIFLLISLSFNLKAQDTLVVHFLYGSKPHPDFKESQGKWFGGILGGHVGVSTQKDSIFHFLPDQEFHYRKHFKERHSKFVMSDAESFKYTFGTDTDSVKMLLIQIPITATQKKTIDSLHSEYKDTVPYDYAFIGMRCAAASYEVLTHIGITKKLALSKVVSKYFYPKKLRKNLLKQARRNNWQLSRTPASKMRIWEED